MGDDPTTRSGIPLALSYGYDDVPESWRAALDAPSGVAALPARRVPGDVPSAAVAHLPAQRATGSPRRWPSGCSFLLEQGETGFIMKRDRVTNDHLYDPDHPEVDARREDVGPDGVGAAQCARDVRDGDRRACPIEQSYAHPGAGVVQAAPVLPRVVLGRGEAPGRRLHQARRAPARATSSSPTWAASPRSRSRRAPGLRLNRDLIEFCTERMPRWVPVSIAGYNGADSGLDRGTRSSARCSPTRSSTSTWCATVGSPVDGFARGIGGVNLRTSMALLRGHRQAARRAQDVVRPAPAALRDRQTRRRSRSASTS